MKHKSQSALFPLTTSRWAESTFTYLDDRNRFCLDVCSECSDVLCEEAFSRLYLCPLLRGRKPLQHSPERQLCQTYVLIRGRSHVRSTNSTFQTVPTLCQYVSELLCRIVIKTVAKTGTIALTPLIQLWRPRTACHLTKIKRCTADRRNTNTVFQSQTALL